MLAEASAGRCSCGSISYLSEYKEAFGVLLCSSCKRNETLIAKGAAKDKYLLTDSDLSKLGSLSKDNPRHRDWQPMKLYLESQVQELSRQKWGDTETLEQTRDEIVRKRVLKRQSRRVDKRRSAEKQEQKLKRVKAKVEKNHGKAHVHVFQDVDAASADGIQVKMCTLCGFKQEVEEL